MATGNGGKSRQDFQRSIIQGSTNYDKICEEWENWESNIYHNIQSYILPTHIDDRGPDVASKDFSLRLLLHGLGKNPS